MQDLRKFSAKNKNCLIISSGSLFLLVCVTMSLALGSSDIGPRELWSVLTDGFSDPGVRNILLYVRLPRTLACVFAGAGLSLSGAILQQVLGNRLASPGIIGVNAGAGLGVTLSCAFGAASGIIYSLSAFAGSLFAVALIALAAYKTRASRSTVILGGVAINAMLNACCEGISILDEDVALMSADFRVGGFSAVSYIRLLPAAAVILVSVIIALSLTNDLDVLSMGDESAQGLGMNVRRTKIIFLFIAALLAGAAVSFSGLLGFLGLIIPHFVRRIAGGSSRVLLTGSCIFGAGFLALSDMVARLVFAPYELPVGIIMAFVGGPVFVGLLIRKRGGHGND